MTETDSIEWPREIWAFAIDHSEFETSGSYATSEFATASRWEGDSERDRPVQRYVDADIYDSTDRYWRERVKALEAQLAEAERRGAERMRERAADEVLIQTIGDLDSPATTTDPIVVFDAIRALPLTEGGE